MLAKWMSWLIRENLPQAQADAAAVELSMVRKVYKTGAGEFEALNGINLQVNSGEFVAVVGKSGSGKSTLINMITGIDRPTEGEAWVARTPDCCMAWQDSGRRVSIFPVVADIDNPGKCDVTYGFLQCI